jgi:hypothetical protein
LNSIAALALRLTRSKWLQVACMIVAFLAGVDDAIEAWSGVKDMLHLDVSHGLIATALSGVLKPLSDFLEYAEDNLDALDAVATGKSRDDA